MSECQVFFFYVANLADAFINVMKINSLKTWIHAPSCLVQQKAPCRQSPICTLSTFVHMELNEMEIDRYSRHLLLPNFTRVHQLRLKLSKIVIIGMGGLGNPLAQYLVAAGIGQLTLIDFDTIEISNLHRQVLFGIDDCGSFKAQTAARKLSVLHPDAHINAITERITEKNLPDLLTEVDLVADCTDNFESRYLIDQIAGKLKVPLAFGAVHRDEGQFALFHGRAGVGYRDVYPDPPSSNSIGNCSQEGVWGPIAGIIGTAMAQCIISYLSFGATEADGRMIRFDGASFKTYAADIRPKHEERVEPIPIRPIIADQAAQLMADSYFLQLIDVREQFEHDDFNIGGMCLPASDLKQWSAQINPLYPVLLYCQKGQMSYTVARALSSVLPHLEIMHLVGGIDDWNRSTLNRHNHVL